MSDVNWYIVKKFCSVNQNILFFIIESTKVAWLVNECRVIEHNIDNVSCPVTIKLHLQDIMFFTVWRLVVGEACISWNVFITESIQQQGPWCKWQANFNVMTQNKMNPSFNFNNVIPGHLDEVQTLRYINNAPTQDNFNSCTQDIWLTAWLCHLPVI